MLCEFTFTVLVCACAFSPFHLFAYFLMYILILNFIYIFFVFYMFIASPLLYLYMPAIPKGPIDCCCCYFVCQSVQARTQVFEKVSYMHWRRQTRRRRVWREAAM